MINVFKHLNSTQSRMASAPICHPRLHLITAPYWTTHFEVVMQNSHGHLTTFLIWLPHTLIWKVSCMSFWLCMMEFVVIELWFPLYMDLSASKAFLSKCNLYGWWRSRDKAVLLAHGFNCIHLHTVQVYTMNTDHSAWLPMNCLHIILYPRNDIGYRARDECWSNLGLIHIPGRQDS